MHMKVRTTTVVAMVVGALTLAATHASAQAAIEIPPVPPGLAVPAGHEVFLAGYAVGTQNYVCLPLKKGSRWVFLGPQATLFHTLGSTVTNQISTHFLSANPVEAGTARPTWQDSSDSSRVWGKANASSTDPNYVQAGAIPWLLVEAVGAALGPTGGGTLAQTTFIHRLNTSGGVAPATGCGAADNVGAVALVPYSTEYYFYRASH
jgi:hypothetical protein